MSWGLFIAPLEKAKHRIIGADQDEREGGGAGGGQGARERGREG